jgi:hypothetical protein
MKLECLCLRIIFTLCLFVSWATQSVYAQEQSSTQVNEAYLDVMSIYAQEPNLEEVAEASLEEVLQEWTFPRASVYPTSFIDQAYFPSQS